MADEALTLSEPMAQCRKLLLTIMKKKEAGVCASVRPRLLPCTTSGRGGPCTLGCD